ncbi:zinc-binding alcohol dehydrogenase family protein [Oceanivirga salmonicida]|uniref:zinc-binding alcohol dehydrogenase family protein n=1 Tax=Oceanivirga salmonicida TaxID=1769291 RepID=UPI000835ADE8|nr:zinc-binding alcohol dehydrogenase family protein [Oceanivirga salmonicida]
MKAIKINEAKKIEIIDVDEPKVKNDKDVKIKIKVVGICGSDAHIYHGTNPLATYPRIIGHEFSGEVVEIGSKVKKLKIGDRVSVDPIVFCGKCYPCKLNRPNICEKLKVSGVHRDGGMQEYFLTTEEKCHVLNKNVSFERAALVEPFTIAAQANWKGKVNKDDLLLIIGAGTIGLCILMYAKKIGAKCIVTDVFDKKLERAKEYGADYIINTAKENLDVKLSKIEDGKGPSVTIDSACLPVTFEDSIRVTKEGGRVVTLGFSATPSQLASMYFVKKELSVYGSRLQTHKFPIVVELFNSGFDASKLISHKFNYKDIVKAFDTFDDINIDTVKVCVLFD